VQQDWESLGIVVLQGYGATECGPAAATSIKDHPTGTVGHTKPPVKIRLDDDTSEILIGGPTVFSGYWQDPEATAAAKTADGWYRTGDIGRFDKRGNLILSGRVRNVIALPNGLKVFPEDMENVLEQVGILHSVVLETSPGRIEAVVLPPDTPAVVAAGPAAHRPQTPEEEAALKTRIDGLIKQANARLGQHQRVDGWRLWPDPDFPRTHTLKIKRGPVRDWVGADAALPIRDADG
jgi:long-chain acyl-CoA synthetase